MVPDIIETLKQALPEIDWFEEPHLKAKLWASGKDKMTTVKPRILKLHQLAKETANEAVSALLHAYAQGLSVIHTKKHAMGLPIYQITAKIRLSHQIDYEILIHKMTSYYHQIMDEIETEIDDKTWASFIEK